MKAAPLIAEFRRRKTVRPVLVHTGQHYDENMSKIFFDDLGLPEPDIYLGVGSGTHAEQTAKVMIAFEKVLLEERPDVVIVVGDVNSTVACSLTAAKLHVPVAHVEAGLRSFDLEMPEEINRMITDVLSRWCFTTSPEAEINLAREGVGPERIFFVGNIMIDSFELMAPKIRAAGVPAKLGLGARGYGVVTLHRPSNVDRRETLEPIVEQLVAVAERLPLVFPVHPRTRARLETFGLIERLEGAPGIRLLEPMA
ncbi:MAG TPA: UDP-N-acetylglucosamine 2-epimerase (non-hydrolyzing), partial [Alphaproteobacteria bacterium]|nr:UDP-N-acetylglucosamine 2-epimerase (non-hydrolyzing) [Alphaproteobacteria bacterium]